MMTDSDCSEDYEHDNFFVGGNMRQVPETKELVKYQKAFL
jgi:hypothetical protein